MLFARPSLGSNRARKGAGCHDGRASFSSDLLVEFGWKVNWVVAELAHQLHDVIVRLAGDSAANRVIGLKDVPSALGRIQLAQDFSPDGHAVSALPDLHIAVAAEAYAVAVLAAQLDAIHPGLRLQRVVRVDLDVNVILEDFF
jgi:hypothetical protein